MFVFPVASIVVKSWSLPLALIGVPFYGLAGVNHMLHDERTRLQDVAMPSDLRNASLSLATCLAARRERP